MNSEAVAADCGEAGTISTADDPVASILESLADGVLVLDDDLRIVRINTVAEDLTGWSRGEALGQPFNGIFQVVSGRSGESLGCFAERALTSRVPRALVRDAFLVDRHGDRTQISARATPLDPRNAWFGRLVLVFHQVERSQWVREERTVAAIAFETNTPQIVADAQGRILRVNRAGVALSGFSREEFMQFNLTREIFTDQVDPDLQAFLRGRGQRRSWSGHTIRHAKDGTRYHFWDQVTAVRNRVGDITHYIATMQDVTQLVEASSALDESRNIYHHLIESIGDGVVFVHGGVIVESNERYAKMMGYSRDQVIGRRVADLSASLQIDGTRSSQELLNRRVSELINGGSGSLHWGMVRSDGSRVELEASAHPATWEGKPAILATVRDITRRLQAERELQQLIEDLERKESTIRMASAVYGIACWDLDLASGELSWSDRAAQLLGGGKFPVPEDLDAVRRGIHREDLSRFDTAVAAALSEGVELNVDYRVLNPGGEIVWINTRGRVEHDAAGRPVKMRGASGDITRRKQSEEDVQRLAYYDPLTGLANRRLFLDRLQQACTHALRSNHFGAAIFLDLDRFKLLNDSLGHAAGDILLQGVATRLADQIRREDTLARLGGDEFVVLLPSIGQELAAAASHVQLVADKLAEVLREKFDLNGRDYHMSASIGAAIFPADGDSAELILDHADAAMYQAKKEGRNTFTFYQPELKTAADERMALEQDLRLAVARNELELYYQPKLERDVVVGVEALLRWNRPRRGLVVPQQFIPVAEETGLIYGIGQWALKTACQTLADWVRTLGERAPGVAVNVSPLQFKHPDFVPSVIAQIERFGIAPGLLTLEITEGILIENIATAVERLNELKAAGVCISIDDFGTGYSSLYYLKHLPLDEIKIDRSYVRDILDDPGDAAIVEAIVAIARHLGFVTVAEGVETTAQAEFLRRIGCNRHQGYLYSRPVKLADLCASEWWAGR